MPWPETRFTVVLPGGSDPSALAWESPTDVLVTLDDPASDTAQEYLRSVVARVCEHAPTALED